MILKEQTRTTAFRWIFLEYKDKYGRTVLIWWNQTIFFQFCFVVEAHSIFNPMVKNFEEQLSFI